MNKDEILKKMELLILMHKRGLLGGEYMPEDSNPSLDRNSKENFLYFTLPMALNYQRNSYKLWESVLKTYNDEETRNVFFPHDVVNMDIDILKEKLTKYKVALQPNKQTEIWYVLCKTFVKYFNNDPLALLKNNNFDILKIKNFININKKMFPYLSGTKICNYWLYVLEQFTNFKFTNRSEISVAPDTHVIQASLKLGLINEDEYSLSNNAILVAEKWKELLKNTKYDPIDIHTPLWLWSRGGFKEVD